MPGSAPVRLRALSDVALEQVSCGRLGLCGVRSPGEEGCGCERWRVCGEQGGREGGRKALWGLGVSPQERVLEAPMREGLLKLSGP